MANERKWTEAQSAAIRERNRTLLLSAAAGSGKTATLTQRVIESITDAENPTDVTRMLVVTFTNAAAGELRDRISDAISEALKNAPGDLRLAKQLLLLPDADICTIDGFCRKLIRDHAADLGLSPDFRIGDEAEIDSIMRSVMEQLVKSAYEGEQPFASEQGFCRFADHLVSSKNESSLTDILCLLYERTDGFSGGVAFYREYAELVRSQIGLAPEKTPWGKRLCRSAARLAEEYRLSLAAAREEAVESLPDAETKYGPAADCDLAYLDRLARASEIGYDAIRQCLSEYAPLSLKSIRRPSEQTERFKELRARFKTKLKELSDSFLYSADEWTALLSEFSEVTSCLSGLMTRFDELFSAEKRRKNLLSFSDLEHFANRLLTENGKPTPLAEEVGSQYDAVYVDEYQDVNSVQHAIFEAIAGERSRFMVGDIKQSIYSFRLAEPDIFASLRAAYPPLEQAGDSPCASIFMSENFRCDKTVIDFVNAVFDRLLGAAGESIGYRPEDRLTFAKARVEGVEPTPAVLAVFHKERESASQEQDRESGAPEEDALDPEPLWVADEIARLLDGGRLANGKPIEPSDVAILLRSAKGRASLYRDALRKKGIPAVSEDKDDFFLNPEILLALCLLNTVDNPRRDIYLSGLLLSPLYRFLPEELVSIRRESEKSLPLYDALVAYVERHPDFEKGVQFLDRLRFLRESAEGMPIDRLLLLLFSETGLLAVGGSDGKGGRQNLLLLYHYARSFAASSFQGLYQFIEYVNEIIRRRRSFRSVSESTADPRAVRIMTVHGSKGLEFPVCFVSDSGRSLRAKDLRNTWLFDGKLGFALMLRDKTGFARVNNPIRVAVADRIGERTAEEELRLLYVALTRARERLYVTGCVPSTQSFENFLSKCRLNRRCLSASAVHDGASYLEWILSAIGEDGGGVANILIDPAFSTGSGAEVVTQEADAPSEDPALVSLLRKRFSFVYPNAHLTKLPGKLSVSRLSPSVLDGSDDAARLLEEKNDAEDCEKPPRLPLLYGGEDPSIAAKRGTATHEFLQFCDLSALRQGRISAELGRLVSEKFLTPQTAELVREGELLRFAESPLLSQMLSAKRLYRELRFNLMLPAVLFTEDASLRDAVRESRILVQGVIDCLFETPSGELILVDYKTDRLDKKDPVGSGQRLLARHRQQLLYYALAVRQMLGRIPDRVLLYSLCLSRPVELPPIDLTLAKELA